jgi:hypothetical protein
MELNPSHPLEDLLLQLLQREASLEHARVSAAQERQKAAARAQKYWPLFKSRLSREIAKTNALFDRHQKGWAFGFVTETDDVSPAVIARGTLMVSFAPFGLVDERPVIMSLDGYVTFNSRRIGGRRLPVDAASEADIQHVLSQVFKECESLPWLQPQTA